MTHDTATCAGILLALQGTIAAKGGSVHFGTTSVTVTDERVGYEQMAEIRHLLGDTGEVARRPTTHGAYLALEHDERTLVTVGWVT